MREIKCVLIITVFVFSFSVFANAQQVPNYLFLEAIDSSGKPVKDATLQVKSYSWENNQTKEIWIGDKQTDEYGKAQTYLQGGRSGFSQSLFRVVKNGYFPFYDLGTTVKDHYTNFKLELLKIPTDEKEKKALGNEQQKREFMWAVKNGDLETVRKMLKSGISPNLSTDDLRGISEPKSISAVLFAVANGDNEMIKIFLKAKVNLRRKEEHFQNILAYYLLAERFASHRLKEKIGLESEYIEGVKLLVDNGAEYKKFPLHKNANALMLAAQNRNINLVKYFLEKGLPINAQDDFGQTVLFYAPDSMFEFLLKSGADPNLVYSAAKESCSSILMHVVWQGNIRLINTLLAYKADVNFTCPNGNNALKTALERKRYGYMNDTDEIIKILKAAGAK